MSSHSTKRTKSSGSKSTSRHSGKNRLPRTMLVIGAGIAFIAVLFWFISPGSSGPPQAAHQSAGGGADVGAVRLEDSRTGQVFNLGQYLGQKDIVLVAYMGDFCLGCRELMAELEQRTADFVAADAYLVGLGYETGEAGRATVRHNGITSYPILQEGPPYTFMRSIGMWSDMMRMPFMGYVIIDKSGKIVLSEQAALSEAKGAGPANVDKLLTELAKARALAGESTASTGGNAPGARSSG